MHGWPRLVLLLLLMIVALVGVACGQSLQKPAPTVSRPSPTQVVAGPREPTWDPSNLAATAKLICSDCGEHLKVMEGGIVFQLPFSTTTFSQDVSQCRSLHLPKGAMVLVRREPGKGRLATPDEIAVVDAKPTADVQVIHLVGPQGVRNLIVQLGKPEPLVGPGETGTVCFARFDRIP